MTEPQQQQQQTSCRQRKQSIWFVRYGLTEHPLVEDLGPYDSDIDPSEGIDHAVRISKRIAACVNTEDSIPAVVYASPFLRTAHTGYIVANELQKRQNQKQGPANNIELRLEEGLWEWLIPSLLVTKVDGIKTNPRPLGVLKEDLLKLEEKRAPEPLAATININYPSVNPYNDSGDVGIVCVPERENKNVAASNDDGGRRPPTWIESEDDLLARCETTLSGLMDLHRTDCQSFCIVSHAPCDQAMAFCLEKQQQPSSCSNGTATTATTRIQTPWPLGGITVFSRPVLYSDDDDQTTPTGFGDWTMELYGNTEHMPGDYKAGLKEWSLPCFAK